MYIELHNVYTLTMGGFNNKEVGDMAENFDIEVKTTAAYRPWSHGLLERHHEKLAEI